ncbi:MAG: cytochrome C oxidase subunit IV family protein [candidate division NC10 bacterium]|nr:cytochrome C oxidase subunit IV family protein [candidate division NC10 bacterium]
MTPHIVSTKIYVLVLAALLALTALTVAASFYDLGGGRLHYANAVTALTIAVSKATLVVLYFMHVRYSSHLTWVFVGAGVFWLLVLIGLTLSDVLTRGWLPSPGPWSS